jgi:hypothetical protein
MGRYERYMQFSQRTGRKRSTGRRTFSRCVRGREMNHSSHPQCQQRNSMVKDRLALPWSLCLSRNPETANLFDSRLRWESEPVLALKPQDVLVGSLAKMLIPCNLRKVGPYRFSFGFVVNPKCTRIVLPNRAILSIASSSARSTISVAIKTLGPLQGSGRSEALRVVICGSLRRERLGYLR